MIVAHQICILMFVSFFVDWVQNATVKSNVLALKIRLGTVQTIIYLYLGTQELTVIY